MEMTRSARCLLAFSMLFCLAMAEEDVRTCKSVGGLKFDASMEPMQRPRELNVCGKYGHNTCCNATHVDTLKWKMREAATANFNDKCQQMTKEMTCAPCHPDVGTSRVKSVCQRFCQDWYDSCASEYYAYSATGSLRPCYGNALVCSPLSTIATTPSEFCNRMGYEVGDADDVEGQECFDGSVSKRMGSLPPSEPWHVQAQRFWEEQSTNPTEWGILATFVPFALIFITSRLMKLWREASSVPSIEEVRRRQQEAYGEVDEDGSDVDTDSVSESEMREEIEETEV